MKIALDIVERDRMEFATGVGYSSDESEFRATIRSLMEATQKAGLKAPEDADLVILMATPNYKPKDIAEALNTVLSSRTVVAGGTFPAGILEGSIVEKGVIAMLMKSKYVEVRATIAPIGKDPEKTGKEVIGDLFEQLSFHPKFVLTLMGSSNGGVQDTFVKGAMEASAHVLLCGCGTGSSIKSEENFQICNGDIYENSILSLGIGGDITPSITSANFCTSSNSKSLMIAKCDNNLVEEFNGSPAREAYEGIPNFTAENLIKYPLGIRLPYKKFIIKTPIDISEKGVLYSSKVEEGLVGELLTIDNSVIEERLRGLFELSEAGPETALQLLIACEKFLKTSKDFVSRALQSLKKKNLVGVFGFGQIFDGYLQSQRVGLIRIAPDIPSIAIKLALPLFMTQPALEDTMIATKDLNYSATANELSEKLKVHTKTIYERMEVLLKAGLVEKINTEYHVTRLGRMLDNYLEKR